jgi:hypothetical protein
MSLLRKGLKVFFDGLLVMVLERKNGLDKKPKFYLLDTQTKTYISSLYFISRLENSGIITEVYAFDYENVKYLLNYSSDGTYKVVKVEGFKSF